MKQLTKIKSLFWLMMSPSVAEGLWRSQQKQNSDHHHLCKTLIYSFNNVFKGYFIQLFVENKEIIKNSKNKQSAKKEASFSLKISWRFERFLLLQGDREAELGLPFSPLCDRTSTMVAQSQIGKFKKQHSESESENMNLKTIKEFFFSLNPNSDRIHRIHCGANFHCHDRNDWEDYDPPRGWGSFTGPGWLQTLKVNGLPGGGRRASERRSSKY